jgi:hypothetical protein
MYELGNVGKINGITRSEYIPYICDLNIRELGKLVK